MKLKFLPALFFVLCGCAPPRNVTPARAPLIVPRECLESVALTEKTQCRGADLAHLACTHIAMTKRPGCEVLSLSHAR